MLAGLAAGTLLLVSAWRRSPWDIHDENSYSEQNRLTLGTVAPTVILFVSLIMLLLGTAVLDKDGVPTWVALTGDALGLVILPFTVFYLLRAAR
jgi:hypothetical protein